MPYLNIDLDFPEHRKTKRLVSILGRGSEAMLLRLWCYTARHHPEDGRLSEYSPEEIESLAGWVGKPGRMIEVMRLVGWLDRDQKGWFIKNWIEHQGHIAAYKARGKAMAEARWQKVRDAARNAVGNAVSNARSEPTVLIGSVSARERKPARLHGIPATVEEVIAYGKTVRVDEARCREFWSHYEGQARTGPNGAVFWVTSSDSGTVITNWKAKLPSFGHQKHGSNRNDSRPGVDRNSGTRNTATKGQYAGVGKVL